MAALLLGDILCQAGALPRAKLRAALREQQHTGRPLGEILLARGDVRAVDLARAMAAQRAQLEAPAGPDGRARREVLFGEIAMDGGWIKAEQLHRALREKADHPGDPRPLGEVLRDAGALDDGAVQAILREQDRRTVRKVLCCRECRTAHDASDAHGGGRFKCRGCGRVLQAPPGVFAPSPAARPAGGATARRSLGPYEIRGEIARGGMGIVYRAVHRTLGRPVALKVLTAGPGVSDEMVQRFKAEARAVARLRHPGVVPVYDIGTQGDRHFVALELIEGRTFDAWVREERPGPGVVARLLAEVADALAHVHAQGIVHRDVKPGNILIDEQGAPHLTDFGLAVDLQADCRLTQSGVALGTPTYMSPEQARGQQDKIDGRSDVFALGVVCYEALAGRAPFVGASVMDTLLRVVQDRPLPLRRRAPKVPAWLEAVCMKALEKERHRRFRSAADMAAALRAGR